MPNPIYIYIYIYIYPIYIYPIYIYPIYISVYIYIYIYIYDLLADSIHVTLFLNEQELICLHTVKWFQVLFSYSKPSILYEPFVFI